MKVAKVMHKGAATAAPGDRVRDIAKVMRTMDIGIVPVVDKGKLVGVVTDRDLVCRALTSERTALFARDIMSRKVATCREDDDLSDALKLMEERQIRRLPIVDEDGVLAGMLSLGDIASRLKAGKTGRLLNAVSAHHE